MYNPYNWTIEKKNEKSEMLMPTYPKEMNLKCILEQLTEVSNDLEMTLIKYGDLKKEFEETEEKINHLMDRKKSLMKKIYD